ncbi:MAG: hypothetical protein QXH08_06860, partial [Candidatus Hadarchaeales archaeon]
SEKRELFLRIIDLCASVSRGELDPFDVRVAELFDRLRELLPKLRKNEELYMDVLAVLGLADVIYHQGRWIKHRSSLLYLDPLLITLKLHALEPKELAEIFVKCWHPLVELEAVSPHGIVEARNYWESLLPLSQRWPELGGAGGAAGEIGVEELERHGILSREEFSAALERLAKELKMLAGEKGEISYWDFIIRPQFSETLERAWLTSFLITLGYADVELRPLEDEIILRVGEGKERGEVYSLPISVTREEWRRRVSEKSGRG